MKTDQLIERVVFLSGDDANDAIQLLDEEGVERVIDHLSNWHYPGEHETSYEFGHGTSDDVYYSCNFSNAPRNYVLSVNHGLHYISLEYIVAEEVNNG
jgi:hypothetical protein